MQNGLSHFMRAESELAEVGATSPHELMRVMEAHFIRDCAEMAARASLYRTESRWGLYHCCRICIDSCPVDCLAVNPETGKAHMAFDECWYCLACEIDCPKDAITVKIPFLLR